MYGYFRKKARNSILDLLSINAVPQPGIHILNGHFLSQDDYTPAQVFRDQLNMLISKGVNFINFDIAVGMIKNLEISPGKCLVAFTFDDGFEEFWMK